MFTNKRKLICIMGSKLTDKERMLRLFKNVGMLNTPTETTPNVFTSPNFRIHDVVVVDDLKTLSKLVNSNVQHDREIVVLEVVNNEDNLYKNYQAKMHLHGFSVGVNITDTFDALRAKEHKFDCQLHRFIKNNSIFISHIAFDESTFGDGANCKQFMQIIKSVNDSKVKAANSNKRFVRW
jgi:hypothetical protein